MAKNITKIEALPKFGKFSATPAKKKRVAAYARVSTDHDEQLTSFEAQKDYFQKMIENRVDWELVKVYADYGISAAGIKRRKEFSQLIQDCEDGKIDIVLVKSISRFARNTVDSLTVIRRLKELGIGIWFEKESIWTLDSKGELLITIMSSISEEESRSISQNVKWGKRKMFQDGKGSLAYSRFLGYDKGENKFEMIINEEQAVIVRRIYRMYLQGFTPNTIAKTLTEDGIPSPAGSQKWSQSTVRSICENEKYKGALCMQKYFQEDFPSKKCHKNDGQLPKYYVEEDHPPIVDPELFDYVQTIRDGWNDKEKNRYSGVDYLSSKIVCGKCSLPFGSRPWHSTTYNNVVWQCRSCGGHKHNGGNGGNCSNHHIYDEVLKMLLHDMAREMMVKRGVLDTVRGMAQENLSEKKAVEVDEYLDRFISGDIWETVEDLDDLSYILKQATVTEDGRLVAEFLDGTGAERVLPEYSPIVRKKAVQGQDKPQEAAKEKPFKAPAECEVRKCRNCGKDVIQKPKVRSKLFCCDQCRMEWWKAHPEALNKKANYECICAHCGKTFISYGNDHRKYCGQECYRAARWGE